VWPGSAGCACGLGAARGICAARKRLLPGLVAACAVVLAAGGVCAAGVSSPGAAAGVVTGCMASPGSCGYPDAADTGVPPGMPLKLVPGEVSRGPGWYYSAVRNEVVVNVRGAVVRGFKCTCAVDVKASDVTVSDVQVTASGSFGVSLRHTTGVTIEDSAVSGLNAAAGRLSYAIDDVYGDSTGTVVRSDNISGFRNGVQISAGMVSGNYIHDPGYVAGDHTNGLYAFGGRAAEPLAIEGNTIFNSLGQTDAVNLDAAASGVRAGNVTVRGNLLAGGSYTVYGGAALGNVTSGIVIQGNRFGQLYYARSGRYGPVAYFDPAGAGNLWSGNVWDSTGLAVPAP
jgi:hypothetical protein